MDKKKRNIIIGAAAGGAVVVLLAVIALFGMFRGFNAQKYVDAVLDQTFKGEVVTLADMTKGIGEAELLAQYEAGITSFAKNSIAGGIEMEPELEEKYVALCKKIFADMKYSVKEDKKLDGDAYEVTVQYQASDIVKRFAESAATVTEHLNNKLEDCEYRGTDDEITAQMQKDFLEEAYPLFEEDYKNMEFGEKETVVIKVEKSENNLYKISQEQITDFLRKILGLVENQD